MTKNTGFKNTTLQMDKNEKYNIILMEKKKNNMIFGLMILFSQKQYMLEMQLNIIKMMLTEFYNIIKVTELKIIWNIFILKNFFATEI